MIRATRRCLPAWARAGRPLLSAAAFPNTIAAVRTLADEAAGHQDEEELFHDPELAILDEALDHVDELGCDGSAVAPRSPAALWQASVSHKFHLPVAALLFVARAGGPGPLSLLVLRSSGG